MRQIGKHGGRGVLHQVAAVEVWDEVHALGQQTGAAAGSVELIDFLVKSGQGCLGHGALAQKHDASTTSSLVMTVPSWWRMVLPSWPSRTLGACTTAPRSRTRTGVPFCTFTTVAAMSSVVCMRPTARTFSACWPRSMKPPPALMLLLISACSTWASERP